MNRIYRTLWSAATQSWQAVPETAKSAGKKSKSSSRGVLATVALGFSLHSGAHAQPPPAINQLPTGGVVVRGTASIQQTATAQAAAMMVNQSSQRAVLNWDSFNLGQAASINFVQPNPQSVTLNRVHDNNPSQIFGRLTANGQVFLSNANGVYFSPTSSVDVGAITATTHSISDDNFMSGRYVWERNGATGKIINEGNISAALGGYVALLAPEVQNAGVVVARAGTVVMAAGEMITLNIDGHGSLAGITTTPSAIATLIENKLAVQAPDGQIILSAVALNKLQAGVVKNSGSLEANSLASKGGKVFLEADDIVMDRHSKIEAKGPLGGGTVLVGGDWQGIGDLRQATKVTMEAGATIDASATDKGDGGKVVLWSDVHNADSVAAVHGSIKAEAGPNGGDGGRIETSGHVLNVDGIGISAQSANGKAGEWLLDPYNVYIMKDATTSGETLSTGTYTPGSAASYIKSSELNTALSSANVTVTTGGSTPGTSAGNIYVYDGVAWSANKLTLNAWSNIYIYYAMNASGTASLALQYGQGTAFGTGSAYYIDAPVNLPAGANFSTQSGSTGAVKNYTVITSLGAKADAAAAPATLTLQGMAASSMAATAYYVLGANIDATDTLNWGSTNSFQYFTSIGTTTAFSGTFDGLGHQITNLKVKYTGTSSAFGVGLFGSIAGPSVQLRNVALLNESISGNYYVGGLYGKDNNQTITIDNIYTSGNISDINGSAGGIGGMFSSGTATNVASSANVTTSFLFSGKTYQVGGLFGYNQATVKYGAYYGTITANATNYAGAINGDARANTNDLTTSYFDSTKNSGFTGTGTQVGVATKPAVGIPTTDLTIQSNFSSLDFVNVWAMGPSYPLPQFMLSSNMLRVVPNSSSIVYGNTPTATMTYVGLLNADTATTAFSTLPTAAAPTNTNVGSQTFYANGGVSSNYTVVYDPGTVTITPKPISVTGISVATTKVYNGSTSAAVSGTAALLSSETKGTGTDTDGKPYTGDTLTITGTAIANYNSKDVTSATTIAYTGTGLTLGGISASNYTLVYPSSVSGSITPKTLTLTSPTGLTLTSTKTYDGTNTAAVTGTLTGGTFSSEAVGTGTVTDGKYYTGDTVTLVTGITPTATYSQSNASASANLTIKYSYVGALSGASAGNYSLSTTASTTGAINKATLSLTGSQVYNGTNTFLGSNLIATGADGQTFSLTGNNATLASANVTLSPLAQSFTGLVLGSSSNGGLSTNYNTVAPTSNVNVSITPATAKLSGNKVYDGATDLTGTQLTITGLTVSGTTQTLGYSGTANLFDTNVATANNYVIGTGLTLTNGTGLANNYILPAFSYSANNSATVNAKPITISLTPPASTYTYDGSTTYSSIASGIPAVASTALVGSDSIGSINNTVSSTGIAQAGNFTITPSGVSLSTGTAANYSFTYTPLTVAVAKAALTVNNTTVANKVYDRTNTATLSGGSLVGVFSGDTVTLTEAGTFASVNVGTGIAVTANDSLGGSSANNYTLTQPTSLSADITPKALTVNNTSVASKTYNGSNTATLSGGSLVGVILGDTVTLTQAGAFASANAGTGIAVTANDSLGGSSASNYTVTQPTSLSADINKAHLTVTASNASKTYGDANPALSATVSGFVNNETLGTSGVTGTGAATTAATATTGAGTAVISAGAGTLTATNYDFTSLVNGTLTINKADAIVTASSANVTYNGLAQTVSGFTASGLVNGETASVLSGVSASVSGTNAGSYTNTASGTDANYNLTFVTGALNINKAHLTLAANNVSKTYGDANPTLSTTLTGFVNGQTLATSGVTGGGTATTTATAATGAGSATITTGIGNLTAANYDFTSLVDGTLTINKAHLTVTANNASKTYGDANPALSATVSGFVNNETLGTSGVTGSGAATTTATATTGAGTATISAGAGTLSAANYDFTSLVDGTLTINKANATVTANSGTTTYNGAAQSVSGFTATGLVNGETTAVLSGVTAGATGTNAGSYTSTASGTDSNYNLSFVPGAFTIRKAPLSLSLSGQTKVYDGTSSATIANGSYMLTGFVSGEGVNVSQAQGSYNSANVLTASSVTASLTAGNYTASNGTLLSNYDLPTSATGTGSITPARLNVTGMKTYDGLIAFDAMGLVVSGVNGETFAASGSGTISSKNVQTNQALASTAGLTLSGQNGSRTSNYEALATSDTQVTVTPRSVNLSAPAASKTYDSTTLYQASAADLATLSNQLVGSDRVTAAEVVYANKNAGTNKQVMLSSVTINDDNGGNNYTVGKLDVNTGVINKAPLTVTVVSDARFVTQTDAPGYAGVVYNGFVGGETALVLTTGNITRSNAGVNGALQYTGVLQAAGWQSNNYNISYNTGDYTIVGAHTLLVRVPTVTTTYGTAATYTPTAQYLDGNNNTIVTLNPVMTGNAFSVSDGAGGSASLSINAANATLSNSSHVQAGGYNLQAGNVVKTGDNFQNLVMTGGLTVNPKILNSNLGVQPITKVYDGSASISNLGLNFNQPLAGVVSGDTVSLVGSGSFDDRHVATNKTVNLSLGLLGADASNYALATPSFSTNTGEITQLASVTYTGASNGNWSDFSNWAGGAMPDRNNVAQVVVPTVKTVLYNSDQVGTIGSTLALDGAIRFTSSNPFTLTNTVSGTGDLQQRGNGMLTVNGNNTNFSGNLDIGSYQATLDHAQALGTGHVVSSGGQLSVTPGLTLAALHVVGAVTVDTNIKTTGDQVYNGALTFLSSGTAQAPNFVSDAGKIDFMRTVSAGTGSMTAQRSLAVSAPNGSVLINDQVGRSVKSLDFSTYLSTGLLDTSPYAMLVTSPLIKLYGDVTTFEKQTYNGAMRVGSNGQNGHTRLLVSIDPSITFKSTVDDADTAGKVNGLDVRAISLVALAPTATDVPTITFEGNVGGVSPLAQLRLAAGTQNTASGAKVTDIKTDDASRREDHYRGDIVFKGDVTLDYAPEMIAEQLLVPGTSQTMTWSTGTADFKLRLPVSGNTSNLPVNLRLVQPGQGNGGSGGSNANSGEDFAEGGRQWLMAYRTHGLGTQVAANDPMAKVVNDSMDHLVADVQVGHENDAAAAMPLEAVATPVAGPAHVQEHAVSTGGSFVQVREYATHTVQANQAFVFHLPADTFVHSHGNDQLQLSATLINGAALPSWIKFSVKDASFSGKAPRGVKSLDVKVTATDPQGQRASSRVHLVFSHGSGA